MEAKILVTLGPTSMNKACVQEMTEYSVDLFRINLSHTDLADLENKIALIQSWTKVPICLDSEGAQLRNGQMETVETEYSKGDRVLIHVKPILGNSKRISFNPSNACKQLEVGDEINVDFHHVKFVIREKHDEYFISEVLVGGKVGSNKAADVNRKLKFECLTKKDREAVKIGLANGVSNFALSFTNSASDIEELRAICGDQCNIISKIESYSGVKNLNEIMERADSILIDRGDLSREIQIERIPFMQRKIIASAQLKKTPVFVATNLLETMTASRSPTRAEVNDVVSTLEMGASGLVLAAETAIGAYPVDAVKMIRSLITETNKWTSNTSLIELLDAAR